MPAQWLSNRSDIPGKIAQALESSLHYLAQPAPNRRLRTGLFVFLALWALLALAQLLWSSLPSPQSQVPASTEVINPVSVQEAGRVSSEVNIERMMAWHLFGEAGAHPVSETVLVEPEVNEASLAGIEKGARETRLDLILRGVVASTADGEGHAIIEHKKKQAVYALDDRLPVSGRVTLVKVLPRQVVLDNGGNYELLTLFEETALDGQVKAAPQQTTAVTPGKAIDKRQDTATTQVAGSYRDKLYQDPQSLAEVVQISAVRNEGELLGYRIAPGQDQPQFEQLGFRSGDLVTAVNGITLSDPANTVRLYQALRSADEAVFELERNGQPLTIAVGLQ